ncbi:MAG: MarR family transcriptional regulator [Micromonosporaceae bacterium]|nr:MarR family transcriptional regulator [Micromonosporaceae bacterium]
MVSVSSGEAARSRRRMAATIRDSLRELGNQLSMLNHHVASRLEIRDVDLDCLDLLDRHGPLSPTALGRLAGLHPATVTGVLDRLQRGGWITRERDARAADRRSVAVRAVRGRLPDVLRLYAGMNDALGRICAGYRDAELELLAGFLRQVADAGRQAAAELADRQA